MAAAVVAALAASVPAYFLGPNSEFAAVVALYLITSGVLIGGGRAGAAAGWIIYVALAAGQAALAGLILAGVLPDTAIVPVGPGRESFWVYGSGQAFLQLVYLAAFLAGRALQRRYRALGRQIEEASRAAARREALLDEARADYRRALVAGRRGWFAGASGLAATAPLAPPPPAAPRRATGPASGRGQPDLAAHVAASGPLADSDLRALVDDASRALEAVHDAGQLHLDVRPRALVRVAGGAGRAWQLLDPAITQLEAARDPESDPTAVLAYAAPERLHGALAGAAADLYGLAASIYAAATGADPFDPGEVPLRGAAMAAAPRPRDPRRLATIPGDLACALRIGLASAPEDRFASAGELRRAFLAAIDGRLDDALREAATRLEVRDPWRAEAAPPVPAARAATTAGTTTTRTTTTRTTTTRTTTARTTTARTTTTRTTPALGPSLSGDAWHVAYVTMMRGFCAAVTALCVTGGIYIAAVTHDRGLVHAAWACLAAIAILAWWHWQSARSRPGSVMVWHWVVAAMLTVGPALAIGLQSGFAAIVAAFVFAGGMFRGPVRGGDKDRRSLEVIGVCAAHTVAFALIAAGVLPDRAQIPVFSPGDWTGLGYVRQLAVLAVYAAAFAAGRAIDRRHEALSLDVEAAARDAARAESLLVTAREEIERALAGDSGGLFSGLRLGDYQVGRLLGRGGVGEVYEATRTSTGRPVALKLLRRERAAEAWHARRLRSEAVALRRVHSAHVARIVDAGDLEGDIPFVAMDFIPGASLADILRQSGAVDRRALGELVRDIGGGLDEVHRAGVLHLDVKPGNLIRSTGAAGWKLVDFGTAQLIDTGTAPIVSGTPSYMSPEQARGAALDHRSDLYSFCLVLYRVLTGRPAFAARAPADIALAAAGPPDPRAYADLSPDLEAALRIGLAHHPADRFATAADLRDAFAAALARRLPSPLRRRGAELLAREPWADRRGG
ncbi:MAG TPA: serine/threonine-protein kinase [Kofleriaceae bacterium]|nr:serine/threonine-protein kinase [Kofleriaceae bacterium]